MKYRIIKYKDKYYIQRKFLFFWFYMFNNGDIDFPFNRIDLVECCGDAISTLGKVIEYIYNYEIKKKNRFNEKLINWYIKVEYV